jgi:hypothetical protein
MGPASRSKALEGGGAAVGDGVDVVPFEVVATFAALLDAADAFQFGHGAEVERGLELGRPVAAEVLDGGDLLGDVVRD